MKAATIVFLLILCLATPCVKAGKWNKETTNWNENHRFLRSHSQRSYFAGAYQPGGVQHKSKKLSCIYNGHRSVI